MASWISRTPWWRTDDEFGLPWETLHERVRSLDGLALLRNSGPRPLETEEDGTTRAKVELPLNGTWRYRDIVSVSGNGGMDI